MARSIWIPPPPPDPETLQNPQPFAPFPLGQLRAGKVKKFKTFRSAIAKAPLSGSVEITVDGIKTDEHGFAGHISPDKAILHYCTTHYDDWKKEIPASEALFRPGGFGENIFNEEISERSVCIGDRIAIGDIIVEVSEPRSPCATLNHRFEVRDMAKRAQTLLRTGWLYRVIKPGFVQTGDIIRLLERPYPEWTVARVMYYLFLDTKDVDMMKQIIELPQLGFEIRDKFKARLATGATENQDDRMFSSGARLMDSWNEYQIAEKRRETSKVTAFVLEAVDDTSETVPVQPGSHVRLKLGGKLVRAYSVVGGDSKRFELGISLDSASRGGSRYLHEQVKVGDVLTVGRITTSFPLATDADEHIIIAAGIGITAFLPALEYIQNKEQRFHLHYAHAGEIPFASQINALGSNASIYDKLRGERLDVDAIVSRAQNGTHFYTCGPARLMDEVVATAQRYGVPEASVHLEQFTINTSGDPFTVELKESKKSVEVGATQTLLDALRAVGMDMDSSCEVGNCGMCKVYVCSGKIEHKGTALLDEEKDDSMLSCVSRGIGQIVLDL